jgi:hypothetical protein
VQRARISIERHRLIPLIRRIDIHKELAVPIGGDTRVVTPPSFDHLIISDLSFEYSAEVFHQGIELVWRKASAMKPSKLLLNVV